METHYQKEKHKTENHYWDQSEAAKYEISLKDKENLFKEIYSNIDLFERFISEAKRARSQKALSVENG